MKRVHLIIVIISLLAAINVKAQVMFTKEGTIKFESIASLETIEAVNHNGTSVIDLNAKKVEFAVLIKAFKFEKALMQDHFNENYMESSKYPKAVYKGQLPESFVLDLSEDGNFETTSSGKLTIHGVSHEIETMISFVVQNGNLTGTTSFNVDVADYEIQIPKLVKDNIAKSIKIDVHANYSIFKKS